MRRSTRSLFRIDTAHMGISTRSSNKSEDLRKGSHATESTTTDQRGSWSTVFQGMRRQTMQHVAISRSLQTRSFGNSDTIVASLEIAVFVLAMIQFDILSRSPRWRENRACLALENCTTLLSEGSFLVPNILRLGIVVLSLVRAWFRFRHLRMRVAQNEFSRSRAARLTGVVSYVLEIAFTVVIPYPGLETFVPHAYPEALIFLSAAVVVRTVFWRHILFFPYPIRQKGKVACFADNFEFSYHKFVLKKVFDDEALKKLALIYVLVIVVMSYLLHVVESANITCVWELDTVSVVDGTRGAESLVCSRFGWDEAIWVIATTCLSTGYGDITPHSKTGKVLTAMTGVVARVTGTLVFALVIKKNQFSTMEARVHSFLYRMDLNAKKDLIAVMAVQATFRFNKSYRQSLIWHQQDQSYLYFRPLSARLPNEVKKKLYVSRFQARLKEIMKYNTDGDLLNAFTKHIEVITAALGITFVEMATLKKLYYRKSRILDDRRRRAKQQQQQQQQQQAGNGSGTGAGSTRVLAITNEPHSSDAAPSDNAREVVSGVKSLGIAARFRTFTPGVSAREEGQSVAHASATIRSSPQTSFHSMQWQTEMIRKCDETLALLKKIEATAQSTAARS